MNFKSLIPILMFSAMAALAATDPVIVAQVDPDEIFSGESTNLIVKVRNAPENVELDTSPLEDTFDVSLTGGPSHQSTTQIINGRIYQDASVTWQYRLVPKKSGDLVVKGPVAVAGERRVAAADMKLKVQEVPPQDLVQVEIVAPDRVYRTAFDVTVRVLVKPLPDGSSRDPVTAVSGRDSPVLQIPWVETPDGLQAGDFREWLQKYLTSTGRGFSINGLTTQDRDDMFSMFEGAKLAMFSLYTGREVRKGLDGSEINYYVYELKRTFTPQRTGQFKFGPVTLKGSFAEKKQGSQFLGKRLVLTAPARVVDVRDVPTPRPGNFIGGIGNFAVTAAATPSALRVGDPLTLRLAVERKPGSSLLDLVSAPDLSQIPEISGDFDIIDKAPTGEVKGESKTFSYGLRPKRAGVNIPALAFSVFDATSGNFKEIKSEPIALNVTAATQLKSEDIVAAAPVKTSRGLKNVEGGIFQNITDVSELSDQRLNPYAYIAGAVLMLLAYGGAAFAIGRQRKLAGDQVWQRRQRAWPEATAALDAARASHASRDGNAAARDVRGAITGLIGNILNLPAAGMTPPEAGEALKSAAVTEALRGKTVALLEQIDALQYASAASSELDTIIASAQALLPELRSALEAVR